MGATNSTRKLTIDSIALLEMLEPNAPELESKAYVQGRVQALLVGEWTSCRVVPFGSSESGLAFGGSDLDLGLYFDDLDMESHERLTPSERILILSTVCARLCDEFEITEFVQHARVPVVKLWDSRTRVACDICIGSVNVLLNTALLRQYASMDPRVRPLAFAVKHWAKQRGINDSVNGTLSSYGFVLLLVFFLQSPQAQSILPPVDDVVSANLLKSSVSMVLRQLRSLPVIAARAKFGTQEQESVGALLCAFFRFYATEFNYEDAVVSIRAGSALPKIVTWNRPVGWRLSIQDPFEHAHDVGRVIFSREGQNLLHAEFERAFQMALTGGRLEEICSRDETAWNWTATCYLCYKSDHKARECTMTAFRLDVGKQKAIGDCWYCGSPGHVKANCPQYAYLSIPNPSTPRISPSSKSSSPVSSPQALGRPQTPPFAAVRMHQPPTHSPIRFGQKKKKRPRHGSIASLSSSPGQERSRKFIVRDANAYAPATTRSCSNRSTATDDQRGFGIPCVT